jgi:hypothetical protein
MERRSHRLAVLLVVVLLHLPLLFAIRDWMAPRFVRGEAQREMVVEFILNDTPVAPPPLVPRSRADAKAAASLPKSPHRTPPKPLDAHPPEDDDTSLDDVRLFSDDGSLRIPPTLSEDIAPKVVEGPSTFHIPAGDTWVLRESELPIEYTETRFAHAFLPADMNPVEEACWRSKGFAYLMTLLGSRDCAAPGRKDAVPMPAMIVYGVDDADDILRKSEDWERYNER